MMKCTLFTLFVLLAVAFAEQPPDAAQQIAYVRSGDVADTGLWVSTIDGKHRKKIASFGVLPRWSPDGARISYSGSTPSVGLSSGPLDLYIYDLTTKKSAPLTTLKGDDRVRVSSWSPDGKQIAYAVMNKQGTKLFVIDVATKETHSIELSSGIDCASEPDWAPDGRSLAVQDCGKDHRGLAIIEPGGKLIQRLTQPDTGFFDNSPAWSPDGKQIAFVSTRGDTTKRGPQEPPRTSIFVINSDGTDLRQLVFHNELSMMSPNWSSDGTLFACEATRICPELAGMSLGSAGRAFVVTSRAIVMNVSDWKIRTTMGDKTSQPALAPTRK